nr:MAG TPA: hypothetical protein [Caudoviricetes sp.]
MLVAKSKPFCFSKSKNDFIPELFELSASLKDEIISFNSNASDFSFVKPSLNSFVDIFFSF